MRQESTLHIIAEFVCFWRHAGFVEQVAGRIARECRDSLWRRVCRLGSNMSIAEIRGYVRAQSAGCVASEADLVLGGRRIKPALRSRVMEAAVDQLVEMVARDVFREGAPAARPIAA